MASFKARVAMTVMALMILLGIQAQASEPRSSEQAGGAVAASTPSLPSDVSPDSGFRLPLVKREDLDEEGKKFYDAVLGPDRSSVSRLRAAWGIWMYSPKVGTLEWQLSQNLRGESAGLSGHVRLLAILVTAREVNSQFLWTAHEPLALEEGVAPQIIDVVKHRKGLEGLPETDAVIIRLGRQMFGPGTVDSDTFARALKLFGPQTLVNLASFMGYFSAQSALLKTFGNQLRPDQKPLLPVP